METKVLNITCINCPVGCRMNVTVEGDNVVDIKDYACPRGVKYAKQEAVAPLRMVTAVTKVEGSDIPLSIKTAEPIPKNKISDCMIAIRCLALSSPIKAGEVVLANVCDTGVDIIATKSV
ncbi:MAG: DUF1667 domain-containing protein [Christensenellaceae bacterium]|nr:DUF1667 domain-containing protein [Christensenellaceae bacterium]